MGMMNLFQVFLQAAVLRAELRKTFPKSKLAEAVENGQVDIIYMDDHHD